jgi:hypothetical protein
MSAPDTLMVIAVPIAGATKMTTHLYAAVVRCLQKAAALRPPSPLHDKIA